LRFALNAQVNQTPYLQQNETDCQIKRDRLREPAASCAHFWAWVRECARKRRIPMKLTVATLAAAIGLSAIPITAQARGIEIGWLDCIVDKPGGFELIRSSRNVQCTYTPMGGLSSPEPYVGTIEKFGLNIGATGYKVMQWKVMAVGGNAYQPGSLAGRYLGVSAEATAAAGVGANVLGGGSSDSFLLQPVSVQEQGGLNVAASITRFTLDSGAAVTVEPARY
jgi:hypothetical protein